ncbi:MAG: hypothetical protein IKG95_09570 [Bacteroidales bacterium]|nr:hypothetical protein [Bacteroidales bacterium]
MKKTGILLILFIALALKVISQDAETTTLVFTANSPGEIYHPFNSVNVTNVTRGWTETLAFPDTVLVLKNTTCIVSPNPFSTQTNVRFQMSKEGRAAFMVCNINGQILASAESWLGQGMHNLTIALEKPQLAILSITTPIDRYAIKLIQTDYGVKNDIMFGANENWNNILIEESEMGRFEIGDIMSYEAIFEDDGESVSSEIITKAQFDNDTITLHFSFPIGAIDGLFSVSETQRVWFSRGNLQYQASSNSWKFADHQYDYMGINNTNVSSSYSGWIDLFGWGTSGFDHGALCYQPWSVNCNDEDYLAYGQWSYNLNDQSGQADWGYNAISNGNNTTQTWRTLSYEEWQYLLDERTSTSGIRYAKAKVNDFNGVILLPDSWNESYYELNNFNQSDASFSCNVINASQWSTLEQYGAVFLPAAGYRHGIEIYNVNYSGGYRSSSVSSESNIWRLRFFDEGLCMDECEDSRCNGQSVRLVYSSMVYDPSVVAQPPTVTTTEVINIKTSTTSGGVVSSDGGSSVIERGICWSTNHNPTIEDDHVSNGFGTGIYSANMHGLAEDTTYYVRAYAINSAGVAYGNKLSFTYHDWSDGVLPGVFSVSTTQKVKFSQGNLQYKASTRTWRFAEDQFEYIGVANRNISSQYDGYIDLFGWGTSGWSDGNTYYQPWDSDNSGGYLYGPRGLHNLTTYFDWGYNAISNGGNQNHQWRTLTKSEWNYVFNTRSTTSGIRYAKAKVNNVNGVILLPDNWSSSYYTLYSTNDKFSSFSSNVISSSTWTYSLEAHGAVFLPAAGNRYGTSVNSVGHNGNYWSASYYDIFGAYYVDFDNLYLSMGYAFSRDHGLSVRLVQDYQPTQ